MKELRDQAQFDKTVSAVADLITPYVLIMRLDGESDDRLNDRWEEIAVNSPFGTQIRNLRENLIRGRELRTKFFPGQEFFTQVTSLFNNRIGVADTSGLTGNYLMTVILGRVGMDSEPEGIRERLKAEAGILRKEIDFILQKSKQREEPFNLPFNSLDCAIQQTLLGKVSLSHELTSKIERFKAEIARLKARENYPSYPWHLADEEGGEIEYLEFAIKALEEGFNASEYTKDVVIPWQTEKGWGIIPDPPLMPDQLRELAGLRPDQILMSHYMIKYGILAKIVVDPHGMIVWTKKQ